MRAICFVAASGRAQARRWAWRALRAADRGGDRATGRRTGMRHTPPFPTPITKVCACLLSCYRFLWCSLDSFFAISGEFLCEIFYLGESKESMWWRSHLWSWMVMVVEIIFPLALPLGDQDIFPFLSPRSSGTANENLGLLAHSSWSSFRCLLCYFGLKSRPFTFISTSLQEFGVGKDVFFGFVHSS